MRDSVNARPVILLLFWSAFGLATSASAAAGEVPWDDMMRGVGGTVVVDHQPYNSGGLASDTLFRENEFLPPTWQLVADDVTLSVSAVIDRIVFWGFYHFNSIPSGDEAFRLRLYDARPADGLPGNVVYESALSNPARNFTGRSIITSGAPAEFRFSSVLPTPMVIAAQTRYWLEIAQMGDLDSLFAWELSRSGELTGQALNNDVVGDWTYSTPITSDAAYQLIAAPEPSCVLILLACAISCVRSRRG
ncbi:MAG: hypothetical protein H6818_14205 [Phycisphaerales bacterium]|nr:hypothetical protein [Phycisphaerales bacterium]MCB9862043.1 hypothetical protein [Phycisphaerales bacterium]